MTKSLLYITAVITLASCHHCIEDEPVDKYYLIEILADPGDGSGTFYPVDSDKFIEFHPDGTITSNGEICSLGIESNASTSGTYSLDSFTISTSDCIDLDFELTGNEMILYYPCIEPCMAKFLK